MWWVGPCFNLLTQLVSPWQRATAIALQDHLHHPSRGVGLGPLVTGVLSDLLLPWSGNESLRHALLLVHLSLLLPLIHAGAALPTAGLRPTPLRRTVIKKPCICRAFSFLEDSEAAWAHHRIHAAIDEDHSAVHKTWPGATAENGSPRPVPAAGCRDPSGATKLRVASPYRGSSVEALYSGVFDHARRHHIEAHAIFRPIVHQTADQYTDRIFGTGIGHARLIGLIGRFNGRSLITGQHQLNDRLLVSARLHPGDRANHHGRRLSPPC